jgi:heme exporter protein C
MWRWFYLLSSPKTFDAFAEKMVPWFKGLGVLFLVLGFGWGLFFVPPDAVQGDAFRILYVHVPCAFLSMGLYAFMGFLSILLLVWRIKLAGVMLHAVAPLGALMAFIALVTGSIWGRPTWGTWWIWDARLTSELILFFLYCAIIAMSSVFREKERGDPLIAILVLVGLVDLPIIHYSVYWWNTLHQGASITLFSKPKIHPSMLYPLLSTLLGFILYNACYALRGAQQLVLIRHRRQQWVQEKLEGRGV